MKNHPKLKFELNVDLDIWKIQKYLKAPPRAGFSFQDAILKWHPLLKSATNLDDKNYGEKVAKYVRGVYRKNKTDFEKTVKKMASEWKCVEDNFYKATDEFFNSTPWPSGKYEVYFTIASPMPRFLDSKTFQVAFVHSGKWRATVAHEMLHFIFYEFVRKKYSPSLNNTIEEEMNKRFKGMFMVSLWDLSEIFNVILLNEKKYQAIFPFPQKPYPNHVKDYKCLLEFWSKSHRDVNKFFKEIEIKSR